MPVRCVRVAVPVKRLMIEPMQRQKAGRPRQDASQTLGNHILTAAFGAFIRCGIERASMDGIAADAGVTKRTLYARYGSKKALLVATLLHRSATGMDQLRREVPDGTLRDRILFVAHYLLDDALTPSAIGLEFLIREVVKSHPDIAIKDLTLGSGPLAGEFYRLLREDVFASQSPDSELRFLADFLFDALVRAPRSRIIHRQEICNTPEARRAYLERALHLISTGLPYLARPRSGDTFSTPQEIEP